MRSGVADKIGSLRRMAGHKPLATNPTEVAWAAGFFDGEGSILRGGNYRRDGRALLSVQIGQADIRPLERFRDAVGGIGNLNGPYAKENPKHKPCYFWRVTGKNAGAALSVIWPQLSEPKREQAIRVFRRLRDLNVASR